MASVWSELKRRNVVKVAIAYVIVGWILVEVAAVLGPALRLPEWSVSFVVFLLILGFPVALVLSWAYELTPDGVKLTKSVPLSESVTKIMGRKLDFIIIGLLAIAVGFFAYDKFVLSPTREMLTIADTTEVTNVEAAAVDKSIAVLPFANMSNDANNDYFAEGLSEEILNLLVKIPDLRVTSRTSAFSFKGQNVDIPTIADKLNVAHVLEGSVRKSSNRLRITAQLIEVASDTHLWSENFERELEDVFAIQDEIAKAVVEALKIKLLGEAPVVRETDPEAYALFLQARYLNRQNTPEASKQAESLLIQSLSIDPEYVPAWLELRSVYSWQINLGVRPLDSSRDLVREVIEKILALDPTNALMHAELASLNNDLKSRAEKIQRALQQDPRNIDLMRAAAAILWHLGRVDEATPLVEYIALRDPVNPDAHFWLGQVYSLADRWDEAILSFRTALKLSPDHNHANHFLGIALLFNGKPEEALEYMLMENCPMCMTGLPVVYHALGRHHESDAALAELIEKYAEVAPYNIAYVYAYRGEADLAFEWLDKAVAYEDVGLVGILDEPLFANIHDDPRWSKFLENIGKSPEQLDSIEFEITLPEY